MLGESLPARSGVVYFLFTWLSIILAVFIILCSSIRPICAGVIATDDVRPSSPTTWTSSTTGYIGKTSSGTMDISSGSYVLDRYGYIGYESGSSGKVTINGVGSTWTNKWGLDVGYSGSGILNVTDGGAVISDGSGRIAHQFGSIGEVTVDGAGSTWTNDSGIFVGSSGNGILNIIDGGAVITHRGNSSIGYESCSTGVVTVDGDHSIWNNGAALYVGHEGNGRLNITNGGAVIVEYDTRVAYETGSSGTIYLDNGTLTTGGLVCSRDDLTGVGTINTHGIVSDVDLVFNATYGLNQILNLVDNQGKDITINLTVDGSGSMGAGYDGVGSMSISDGRVVESKWGCIGYKSGSIGTVKVDGVGSTWTNTIGLEVGCAGVGTLNITNGGTVASSGQIVAVGTMGEVNVNGSGSVWTSTGGFSIAGLLNITNGGAIRTLGATTGGGSYLTGQVAVDGNGSIWTNSNYLFVGYDNGGTLDIINGGSVTVEGDTWVAYDNVASGTIHLDNGTLTTGSFFSSFNDMARWQNLWVKTGG